MSDLSNIKRDVTDNAANVRTYKGWSIDFDAKPIPYRGADWTATHPDYDASYEGPEDGWVGSHPVLTAATEKELWAEIDEWEAEENDGCHEAREAWLKRLEDDVADEACLRTFEVCFGDPRKSMQSVYVVRAETEVEAAAEGKRMARADRIPQPYWATHEVRA